MPHLLLVRSGQDKGNPVCAAATGAAAAALIKQLANSLDHEAAIPHSKLLPGRGHVQRASFHVLLSIQFSSVPAPPPSLPLSPTSLISTHRTRCLTISMLQQWQQSDCLCRCLSPSSLSSLSLFLCLCLSRCVCSVYDMTTTARSVGHNCRTLQSIYTCHTKREREEGRGSNLLGAMCHVCSVML